MAPRSASAVPPVATGSSTRTSWPRPFVIERPLRPEASVVVTTVPTSFVTSEIAKRVTPRLVKLILLISVSLRVATRSIYCRIVPIEQGHHERALAMSHFSNSILVSSLFRVATSSNSSSFSKITSFKNARLS